MTGAFPLAVYTAGHGLAWTYLKSAIPYAELDRCRTLLGPLPDFDAGDRGYEGVAAEGDRVFAIRCFSAPKWDFMGRDATYLAVVWIQRERAPWVDFEALLRAPEMSQPLRRPPLIFRADAAWRAQPGAAPVGDRILLRRPLGAVDASGSGARANLLPGARRP